MSRGRKFINNTLCETGSIDCMAFEELFNVMLEVKEKVSDTGHISMYVRNKECNCPYEYGCSCTLDVFLEFVESRYETDEEMKERKRIEAKADRERRAAIKAAKDAENDLIEKQERALFEKLKVKYGI